MRVCSNSLHSFKLFPWDKFPDLKVMGSRLVSTHLGLGTNSPPTYLPPFFSIEKYVHICALTLLALFSSSLLSQVPVIFFIDKKLF